MVDCKDRWKNLQAVFVRHMEYGPPATSGVGAKKKNSYYLETAMNFAIPYLMPLRNSAKNMPVIPQQDRNTQFDDDNESSVFGQNSQSSESRQPSVNQPSAMPQLLPLPLLPSILLPMKPQSQGTLTEQRTQQASKMAIPKCERRNDAVGSTFLEYSQVKKSEPETTPQKDESSNPRSEALRMFLLSMLPDIESMTDIQVRQFKRRCLQAMDDILSPLPQHP